MISNTTTGAQLNAENLYGFFDCMVGRFFKILPMREDEIETLPVYMRSMQIELLGCKGLIDTLYDNALYVSLLSILQYLIDDPNCEISEVKREVFKAIEICNKLKSSYSTRPEEGVRE